MRYTAPTLPNRKRSGVSATPSPKSDRRACRAPAVTAHPAAKLWSPVPQAPGRGSDCMPGLFHARVRSAVRCCTAWLFKAMEGDV